MKKKKIWICSDPAPLFPEGGSADLIPHQNEADPKHSNLGWVYPYISYLVPIYLVPCGTDLSVYLSIYQYLYLYIYRPAELIYLSVYIYQSICFYQYFYLPVYRPCGNVLYICRHGWKKPGSLGAGLQAARPEISYTYITILQQNLAAAKLYITIL